MSRNAIEKIKVSYLHNLFLQDTTTIQCNSYYLCIVVVRNIVVIAYLINREKHEKCKVGRWVR